MFTIMWMPNAEKFLSLVNQSCGDVLLHLPDGSKCSLKGDSTAGQMLRTMRPGWKGISITLSDPGDGPSFVRYMMEAGL